MELSQTPGANRLHIGIFGRTNSGKSTLVNALAGQEVALTSQVAGTTTDPVSKAVEIHPLGPCLLTDTAGFDDDSALGELRIGRTRGALEKTDIALLVIAGEDLRLEREWVKLLRERKTPVIAVINQTDALPSQTVKRLRSSIREELGLDAVEVSALKRQGIGRLRDALVRCLPQDFQEESITGYLVSPQDVVLLVMPQDIQAPKGRLILPQVQTIRDLMENRCLVLCTTTATLDAALSALSSPPSLIITDSQVFPQVYEKKPPESRLTSFSVLFAAYKGDIREFVAGAGAIQRLTPDSRVLIAEACAHSPLEEDIGRVKIPRLLRKRVGEGLKVDMAAGMEFPEDLSGYDLIIHCGACMFNRKYVLNRIESARRQGVPITNYGVAIAALTGILDKLALQ